MSEKKSKTSGKKSKEIVEGRAGFLLNCLCCPFVCPIITIYRYFTTYCLPCISVLFLRFTGAFHKIICCCQKWPYEDSIFNGAKALGDHSKNDPGKQTAEQMEAETDWVRAKDLASFEGKRPQLFEGEIEPADLCQGAVGDCWLVAAMACASENAHTIRQAFVTKEYNKRGLYKVKIFDPFLKKKVVITVDDRIPCAKGTKKPRFMSPHGCELWAIIMEKAFAKYCGSYAGLDGGFTLWAWHALTGDNVFQMTRDRRDQWYREDMVAIEDKNDKRACGFRKRNEVFSVDDLWNLMVKYGNKKSLMSAAITKDVNSSYAGPNGEQMLEDEGLVAGHAYSVLKAVEVTNSKELHLFNVKLGVDLSKGESHRLVFIRNPWGSFEWKGQWSDKSSKWKEFPYIAKKLNFTDADDGAFWMSWTDFMSVFSMINVCDRTTQKDASLDINENDGSWGIIKGCLCSCKDHWLCCHGLRNLYCSRVSSDETMDAAEKGGCCCKGCYLKVDL